MESNTEAIKDIIEKERKVISFIFRGKVSSANSQISCKSGEQKKGKILVKQEIPI